MTIFQIFGNKWEEMDNLGFARNSNNCLALKFSAFANYSEHLGAKIWQIIDTRCECCPVSVCLKVQVNRI